MRYYWFVVVAVAQICAGLSSARADILFLDLNLSIKEIVAAKQIAKLRGERLLLYPERSTALQSEIEAQRTRVEDLKAKLEACRASTGNCEHLGKLMDTENRKLQALTSKIGRVDGEALSRIVESLASEKAAISTVVISGHSGGAGFGGIFGSFEIEHVRAAFANFPDMLQPIRSILLWGCYTGTFYNLHTKWKNDFPSVRMVAGYEGRAPSGMRDVSGQFLSSLLLHEEALLAAPSLEEAHQIFRSIDWVADLDGTAEIGDFFLSYDRAGHTSEMLTRCQEFPASLYDEFRCYYRGQKGCENPPLDHGSGPLRELYTFLQVNRHCYNFLIKDYPELPEPEYLLRLIYLDPIKENFLSHHRNDLETFAEYWTRVGFSAMTVDQLIGPSRARDIERFELAESLLYRRGARDGSIVNDPQLRSLYHILAGEQVLQTALVAWPYRYILGQTSECIPLSWIDPGATETDRCGFADVIREPMSAASEAAYQDYIVFRRLDVAERELDPTLYDYLWLPDVSYTLNGQAKTYVTLLSKAVNDLTAIADRSPFEERLLPQYERMLQQASVWTDRQAVDAIVEHAEAFLIVVERQTAGSGAYYDYLNVTAQKLRVMIERFREARGL